MCGMTELFLKAKRQGNKIISLLQHAQYSSENENKSVDHLKNVQTVVSSEQDAMQ